MNLLYLILYVNLLTVLYYNNTVCESIKYYKSVGYLRDPLNLKELWHKV